MRRYRRIGRMLATATVGALVAAAYLLGVSAASDESRGAPVGSELLRLSAYCRHLHGQRAAAYQPLQPDGWRCSAWRNGVWGLEPVDLAAACRWQAGPGARLESPEGDDGRDGRDGRDGPQRNQTGNLAAVTSPLLCVS